MRVAVGEAATRVPGRGFGAGQRDTVCCVPA